MPHPFKEFSDVLRIFTAEILESEWIGCIEVVAKLDPLFRFQWTIDLEDLARSGLDMGEVLHCHVEIGIPPMEILFFSEKLNRSIKMPETVGRDVELGMQIASGKVMPSFNADLDVLRLYFQSLERLDAIQLAPLDV